MSGNSKTRRKARRALFSGHVMFSINLENGERYWPIEPRKSAPRDPTIVSPEMLERLRRQLAGMMK